MSQLKKHVGKIANTDRRCVVVIPQLLDANADHCLIVDTDALPDYVHDFLFKAVESAQAQEVFNLSEALVRFSSPDPGSDMLMFLHNGGYLQKVLIKNVTMYPKPNTPCPLEEILTVRKGGNIVSEESLLREAEKLEKQAKELREKAKQYSGSQTATEARTEASEISGTTQPETPTTSSASHNTLNMDDLGIDPTLPPEMQQLLKEENRKLRMSQVNEVPITQEPVADKPE